MPKDDCEDMAKVMQDLGITAQEWQTDVMQKVSDAVAHGCTLVMLMPLRRSGYRIKSRRYPQKS